MNINLYTWHGDRELDFCPKHFTKCNTVLSESSKMWILEKLSGRFYFENVAFQSFLSLGEQVPYFEDPQEAVLYELTWS